jgi:hypothetical protein
VPTAKKAEPLPPAPAFLVIPDDAIFTMKSLRATLGIRVSLKYQIRRGELKVFRRCGRYYTTGIEVKDWIRRGEVFGYGRQSVGGNGIVHS